MKLDGGNATSSITINGGKLSITSTDTSSNFIHLVLNAGTIDVPTPGTTFTVTSGISGNVGLIKTGVGTLELSGANTFDGLANVMGGILAANGSLTGGASVGSGATLQGVGSVGGAVAVNNGGAIVVGNPVSSSNRIGILTLGSLALNPARKPMWKSRARSPAARDTTC